MFSGRRIALDPPRGRRPRLGLASSARGHSLELLRLCGIILLVSSSAAQAHAFYADVLDRGEVWAIRDGNGYPAPEADGGRVMPFWSSRARAQRIIDTVEAYRGFQPVALTLQEWRSRWIPGLLADFVKRVADDVPIASRDRAVLAAVEALRFTSTPLRGRPSTPVGRGKSTSRLKGPRVQVASQQPVKDSDRTHPVADAWRPVLREIVKALVEGDYQLSRGVSFVEPPSKSTGDQMRDYIVDYGEALAELPDETWSSSEAQWVGTHWDTFVDLWTVESGRSDMVLYLHVFEADKGFGFEIWSVHVP